MSTDEHLTAPIGDETQQALHRTIEALDWRNPLDIRQVQLLGQQLLERAFGYRGSIKWDVKRDQGEDDAVQLYASVALVPHDVIPIGYWVSVVYTPPSSDSEQPNDPFDATVTVDVRDHDVAQVGYRFDIERRRWMVVHHSVVDR